MTIQVTIKNEGPHNGLVCVYDEDMQIVRAECVLLKPGESHTMAAWEGRRPLVLATADRSVDEAFSEKKFYTVPPCDGG